MEQRGMVNGSRTRIIVRRVVAPLMLSLGACAAVKRPPITIASLRVSADSARRISGAARDTMVDRLARRVVKRGDNTLDVLLLSGGGQMSAYGVGYLRGWRSRADSPMPTFDLVTGVSTGALQAPFALVGSEAALDTIVRMYRNAANEFAPTVNWFFWLRRNGGVVKTDKFERAVERAFDPRMRDQVRAAFLDDRQLAVATTDLDLGIGRVWDIAHEMDTTAAGLERTRTILRTSSSIPSIFPPVLLDGHVHTDGGSISNVLTILDLEACKALVERLRARGITAPVTVRVWTILNLWTHQAVQVVNPADRNAIHLRADLLMLEAMHPQLIERLALLADAVNATVPGLRIETHYTAVPIETAADPAASKLFDTGFMNRLADIGYARARGATPWDGPTTPYERPVEKPPEKP